MEEEETGVVAEGEEGVEAFVGVCMCQIAWSAIAPCDEQSFIGVTKLLTMTAAEIQIPRAHAHIVQARISHFLQHSLAHSLRFMQEREVTKYILIPSFAIDLLELLGVFVAIALATADEVYSR